MTDPVPTLTIIRAGSVSPNHAEILFIGAEYNIDGESSHLPAFVRMLKIQENMQAGFFNLTRIKGAGFRQIAPRFVEGLKHWSLRFPILAESRHEITEYTFFGHGCKCLRPSKMHARFFLSIQSLQGAISPISYLLLYWCPFVVNFLQKTSFHPHK